MADYKIQLGVSLDTSDLKTEINKIDDRYKVKLGVDLKVNDIRDRITQYNKNTNNAKLKLGVSLDTDDLKKQINNLNLGGSGKGKGVAIPVDTGSLKESLEKIDSIVDQVRKSLGSLDDVNTKSLVSAVNQIANALEKATSESDGLVASLRALSQKDFSVNFGFNMGKSASQISSQQGDIKRDAISQLKQQAKALEDYLDQYYKVSQKQEGVVKLTQGTNLFSSFWEMSPNIGNTKISLKQQVATYKQYIDLMQEAAKIKGIDLSSVTSGFSKTTDDIVKGTNEATNSVEELKQSFKGLFGSGVDSEVLTGISQDLSEIKKAFEALSSIGTIDGLTTSFRELSEVLDKLTSNITTVKKSLDDIGNVGGSVGQSSNGVENLEQDLKQVTNAAETASDAIRQTANEVKKLDNVSIDISDGDVDGLRNALKNIKVDDSDIEEMISKLREMGTVAKSVSGTLKDGNLVKWDVKGIQATADGLERVVTITNTLKKDVWTTSEKYSQAFDKMADAAAKIRTKLDDTGFDGFTEEIQRVHVEVEKLSGASTELRDALKQLDIAFEAVEVADQTGDIKGLISANEKYEAALKQVYSQLKLNQQAEKELYNQQKLTQSKKSLSLDMDNWLKDNTRAAKDFGEEIRKLQRSLDSLDADGVKEVGRQFNIIKKQAQNMGKTGLTVFDKLKNKFKEYASYLSAAELFMYAEQALTDMFEQVKLIDSAMTELKKVTDETDASYNRFLTNAASRAKEIGTTIDGLVSSTADFARLGYDFADAQGLAEVANIYAVVGDDIDSVETATQSLISTLTAFKNEAGDLSNSDFALNIVDKMNEVANNYAISSGGIGEALQRSASSMYAANNSLDETIALITAANTVVQDPDSVGTAFKTISMRIRGAKTELEEAGLETDGMVESTAKLREEILALSGVDIMINDNEFKSTYQIMDELADKWENLTDIQQATVTELIAGKRQGNIVSSLMENFDIAEQALETSLNSAGSAMKEHEKWQQSLEAQILKLKAAWQGLSQAFLSSDFLKGTINVLINFLEVLTKIIDTVGVIPTLLGGFGLFKLGKKGLGSLFGFKKSDSDLIFDIAKAVGVLGDNAGKSSGLLGKIGKSFKGVTGGATSAGGALKSVGSSLLGLVTSHPYITAAVVAVTALTAAFAYQKKQAEDLAKEVDELTDSYKEQHNELKKLEGDFDTSNDSSMVSRYEKLSKGVDNLGRNVSLTADEYSEYQGIVNKIAEQFPSLITGYDAQGNALLSCKGNVEELTTAYENLIHAQNQEILTNTGSIEKDFANTLKSAEKGKWYKALGGIGGGTTTSSMELLEEIINGNYSEKEIKNLLKNADDATVDGIYESLNDAGIGDLGAFWTRGEIAGTLADALKKDSGKIKNIIEDYYGTFNDAVDQQKTIAQAKLSEAFDVSSTISGLDYSNIGEDLQAVAYQVVNSLDYDFFSNLSESGKSVEQWITEMLDQLNSISSADSAKIEAGFDLQTKFNGGDISYGNYIKNLREIEETIDKLNLKPEVEEQLKISLGLDENGIVDQYDALVKRLTSKEIGLNDKAAKNFLNSLSAEELSVLVDIIPELDAGTTINEIQAMIDEQLAAEFKFDIQLQIAGIEAFNTALSEARSATGLTAESIEALTGRYEDLKGFNAGALFERTALGVRLNNEELARLEAQYENVNKLDIDKNLSKLVTKYQDLTEKIKICTDAQEKEALQAQADAYADKIEELQTLSAQYDGLTSSFSKWQTAQSSPNDGDNYDSVFESLEGLQETYKAGLVGTDDFRAAVQLMSNEDLSTASIDTLVSAYKDGLPKMQKYFTEGQKGCKNFLNDLSEINSEWAHLNEKGEWEIDVNVEEAAEKLNLDVSTIYLILNKLKDYGFEVNIDDTSLKNIQTDIEKTEARLKELGITPHHVNLDVSDIQTIDSEINKLKAHINEIKNDSSISVEAKTAQLDDARAKLEVLIQKKQEASQPSFMNLDTSQVKSSMTEALGYVQEYQNAINNMNMLLELQELGIEVDDSELDTAKQKVDEYAKLIQGLPDEVKLAIGLKEDASIDDIKAAFANGDIVIDADTSTTNVKIEKLAENIERIEDKDVTITVTIDGLEDVKELNENIDKLNKSINLDSDINGNVGKLSEYVEGAKTLSELDDNIASFVTAEVKGNVLEKSKKELKRLGEFAEHAKILQDTDSKRVDITANINGNVTNTKERAIDNLDVFVESAKGIKEIEGNITSNITANTLGSVFEDKERNIDNLKTFIDSANGIKEIEGDIVSNITANTLGSVFESRERSIDNLETFIESAKGIKDIEGNIISNITANTLGSVFEDSERTIDNLDVFIESAKGIKEIEGNIVSNITANTLGSVFEDKERNIDNIRTYIDSANGIKEIEGDIVSNITANTLGSVFEDKERVIDNLDVFIESAKGIKEIQGDIVSNITANTLGSVFEDKERVIDNLDVFVDSAKGIREIEGDIVSNITANVDGNVVGDKTEAKINNLEVFADGAKELQGIGSKTVDITANIYGNVPDKTEGYLDDLQVFAKGAKDLQNVASKTVEVTANIHGNVPTYSEGYLDDLQVFAKGANALQNTASKTVDITANANGNAISGDGSSGRLSSLTEFKSLVEGMSNQNVTVSVTANVDSANINQAIALLTNLNSSGVFKDYKATVQIGAQIATIDDTVVQNYIASEKTAKGKVKWANDESLVNQFKKKIHQATGKVNWKNNTKDVKKKFSATGTVTWTSGNNVEVKVVQFAKGTADADGSALSGGSASSTSGRSFARGNWGIKGNGVALGGELGRELVVRDGKFFTIGDKGAEFFRYKQNDIVFNATQTEALFKYGGIKGANPRGKMLASGSAFAEGNAFADASGGGKFYNSSTGESYGSSDSSSESNKDFEDVIDLIEIAIDRIERNIDTLDRNANNVFKSWSSRSGALIDEISAVKEEIALQQQAEAEYLKAAAGVGLDQKWIDLIENGAIDIETITDEALAEKISSYQDYYEAALDAADAVVELQEKESELYQQRFDNITTQYEGMLSIIEHEKNMLDEYIAQSEAQAHLISENYYKALINNEKEIISTLQTEKSALIAELNTQERGTEQWYENVKAIDEVTLAIAQSNTAILEWQQSIQQLKWEQFDLLQEKISAITQEADFLVELLSNDKLFDDNGKLTDEGSATLGLYGVNYNTYMHQADLAREEAERIKKELSKDPYDTELEARYREMIALQQEHILAAEGEKEAIRDLVEEGIETQLDSLQELIDKKNELLESERDLYEYQKKVKEQTKEIAALEKQLSAYDNDDSEETQAKIQQIKVDLEAARQELEETETDRLIESTAALLDNLYIEYEEILNMRLDNIDALIADVIAQINADASSINTTLTQAATDVGYNLSSDMSNIWDTNSTKINNVITTYGDRFSSAQTTTNAVLGNIKTDLSTMIGQLNSIAKTNAKSAANSSAGVSGGGGSKPTSTGNNNNNNNGNNGNNGNKGDTGSSASEIKVGGKINAGSAPIYDFAGDTSGERQLYRNDPIYTVLSEKNGYILTRWHKLSSGYTGWFKKSDVKAYATGAKRIDSDDLAWTQEGRKQEFIVRPSDGAILTPVAKGDSVLNANASRNIWNMANSPAEFIRDNLSLGSNNVPNNSSSQNVYSQNFENITFSLPNVRNYNELLSDMQKDPKFEKLILAMTTDQIAGKSRLAKGKAIR